MVQETQVDLLFEYMYAADKNIEFLKDGKGDVIHVISDNGVADFETTKYGGIKQLQQAKAGIMELISIKFPVKSMQIRL